MRVLRKQEIWNVLHQGNSARLPEDSASLFTPGTRVKAKVMDHSGHIRLPEYVRGCIGVIISDQGSFIFPDAHAEGEKRSERLYSVRFESGELWGSDVSESPSAVYVDLFESYLESV